MDQPTSADIDWAELCTFAEWKLGGEHILHDLLQGLQNDNIDSTDSALNVCCSLFREI